MTKPGDRQRYQRLDHHQSDADRPGQHVGRAGDRLQLVVGRLDHPRIDAVAGKYRDEFVDGQGDGGESVGLAVQQPAQDHGRYQTRSPDGDLGGAHGHQVADKAIVPQASDQPVNG